MSTALSIRDDDFPAILEDTRGIESTRSELIRNIARQGLDHDSRFLQRARSDSLPFVSDRNLVVVATDYERVGSWRQEFLPEFSPRITPQENFFAALQEWEGYVVEIGNDSFTARLRDVTAGGMHEEEEAEFPLDDISESDRDLLKPGAIFRWAIGYLRTRGGTKRRISQIVFRRLPQWTARDLDDSLRDAKALVASLGTE